MSEKEESSGMHYVRPKRDCIHCRPFGHLKFPKDITKMKCEDCGCDENWLCLSCGKILCSRYKNSHMANHHNETKHPIAISFSDLSFWCFKCDSYIQHQFLKRAYESLHSDKFGAPSQETEEILEEKELVKEKARLCADLLMKCKHCVIYTGAGISTSAMIGDFRGPTGAWVVREQGVCAFCPITLEQAEPTPSHFAIADLYKRGFVNHVVSTNVDGLHIKSGIPIEAISELHGNAFKEICVKCGKVYYRDIDVASDNDDESKITVGDFAKYNYHFHGRRCESKGGEGGGGEEEEGETCNGHLIDTMVAFGENLPTDQLEQADEESKKCDLAIVIGTKMSVRPACKLPFKGKRRNKDHMVVYINLQKSSADDQVDIKVYNYSDVFFEYLMEFMGKNLKKGK